jgi:hypothetical protein
MPLSKFQLLFYLTGSPEIFVSFISIQERTEELKPGWVLYSGKELASQSVTWRYTQKSPPLRV